MSRARLKYIKITPEEYLYFRDMEVLAAYTGFAGRCKGGRIIAKGYICIHCGNDYSNPDVPCGETWEQALKKIEEEAASVK